MAWQRNGTPVTLTSSGDAIAITDLTAKTINQYLLYKIPTGGQAECEFQFNNNGNTVYAKRTSGNGTSDNTSVNQTNIKLDVSGTNDEFIVFNQISISGKEKLSISHLVNRNTAGAGNAPHRLEDVHKFVPSPDADITSVDVDNSFAGSFDVDTNLSALGTN